MLSRSLSRDDVMRCARAVALAASGSDDPCIVARYVEGVQDALLAARAMDPPPPVPMAAWTFSRHGDPDCVPGPEEEDPRRLAAGTLLCAALAWDLDPPLSLAVGSWRASDDRDPEPVASGVRIPVPSAMQTAPSVPGDPCREALDMLGARAVLDAAERAALLLRRES